MTPPVLGYVPFITPIAFFHDWWYLLLPVIAFGIAIIYKAMYLPSLDGFWRKVGIMTLQIVLGIVGLAILLTIVVQLVIPLLPVDH